MTQRHADGGEGQLGYQNAGYRVTDHFADVNAMVDIGADAPWEVVGVQLACQDQTFYGAAAAAAARHMA